MGVTRKWSGVLAGGVVALAGVVAVLLSGCTTTDDSSGHSFDVAPSARVVAGDPEHLRVGAVDSDRGGGFSDPESSGTSDGTEEPAGSAGITGSAASDGPAGRPGSDARVSGSSGETSGPAGSEQVPGGGSPAEDVVDPSGAEGVSEYLVPLPEQTDSGPAGVRGSGSDFGVAGGSVGAAPETQPSSTWQMPYRVVRYCGTVGAHEVGTSFFTDGTTGWTQKCLNQMAAAARASGSTLPQVPPPVSPAPAP